MDYQAIAPIANEVASTLSLIGLFAIAAVGLIFILDLITAYKFVKQEYRTVSYILVLAAVLFIGMFPFLIAGVWALALFQTTVEARKKKRS